MPALEGVAPFTGDPLTVAIFYAGGDGIHAPLDLALVDLGAGKAEGLAADAVARGYRYAGCVALSDDAPRPRVEIEPDCAPVMILAVQESADVAAAWLKRRVVPQTVRRA